MLKLVSLLLVGTCLAGCEERDVARARNEKLLPSGCRIIDLDYRDLSVVVVCDSRTTNTGVRAWQNGKIHKTAAYAVIE